MGMHNTPPLGHRLVRHSNSCQSCANLERLEMDEKYAQKAIMKFPIRCVPYEISKLQIDRASLTRLDGTIV
jgi:hypothetical protein